MGLMAEFAGKKNTAIQDSQAAGNLKPNSESRLMVMVGDQQKKLVNTMAAIIRML